MTASFPQAPVVDRATRANETLLAGRWTCPLISAGSGLKLVSNRIINVASPGSGYWNTVTSADSDVYAIFPTCTAVAAQTIASVLTRVQNPGTTSLNGYRVTVLRAAAGGTAANFALTRYDANVSTTLPGTTAGTFAPGDGLGIRCNGSSIECWRYDSSAGTWAMITSTTDTTYTAAGYPGLMINQTSGDVTVSTFGVGPIVFTVPTVSLRIAPGSKANDLYPSWTEVSSLLRGFTFTRGRQGEGERAEAGTAAFVMNNSSRILDPSYTAGVFYPQLKPNMQISLQATYDGATYDLFRGHVERFATEYDGPNYGQTTLECVDRFEALSQATVSGTFDTQLTGARILAVLAAAGWPTTVTPSGWRLGTGALGTTTKLGATLPVNVLDTGKATVDSSTFQVADAKKAIEHINEVVDSEPGRFFFDGAGRAVFQDRSHVVPIPDPSMLTLTDEPTLSNGIASYTDITLSYEVDRVKNDIQLTASDTTVVSRQDATSIDTYWRRSYARTTLLRSSDSDIWQQAGWYLWLKKNALLRVETISFPVYNAASYQALMALELGDHITVVRTPPGDTDETVTQECIVEKLTVDAAPGPKWTVVLQLSPMPAPVTPWRLGTSRLGTDTKLVYA